MYFTCLNTPPSHTTWSSRPRGLATSLSLPTSLLVTTSAPRPPVNYSEQASFSSHTNPLPLLKDGARPTSGRPPSPRAAAAIPPPRASENGRCISRSTTPHEGPREESVGSDFAQGVYLCGGLPKEGVSALSSHATSFLYYLPKFQPMCFLTIKYYLIEVCVPPQLFPPLSLRGHVIFDCVSPDFNNESEIGLTNLVNPDEQRNQLFCCCCCFVFLLWN